MTFPFSGSIVLASIVWCETSLGANVTIVLRQILIFGTVGLVLSAAAAQGRAQQTAPPKVIEVRVEGNERMSDSAVIGRIKTRVGTFYDESVVRADEKILLRTGRFDSVLTTRTYTTEGVIVTFVVSERPLVKKVVFEGNKTYSDDELAKELTFGISDSLNRFSIESGRKALSEKYRSKGYHFAVIELDTEALGNQQVIYRIVEGPQVKVTKIKFKGRKHFTGFRLKRFIGSSARFWPIVAGYIDVEQIDRDVQAIRNLYVSEGFLDVQVGRVLEFSDDKKTATVMFAIDEGPRFRIDRIIFEGSTVFSDSELARRIKLRRGKFFTAAYLRQDIKTLEDTYGELGYIDARVTSRKRFLDPTANLPEWARELDGGQPALLNLVIRISEADQYRIGRIDIRGNTVTQSRIIRRELRFFPEQLLNMVAVNESSHRLQETRLFESVSVTPVGQGPKVRNVLVEVSEARTGQFLIGAGVSTNTGILGNVSFTQRNFDILRWPAGWGDLFGGNGFKGAGQTLRVVAEPGIELMRFHVDWFEPYLFDQPYSLGTKAFLFVRGRENYDETRFGGVVSVGHRFKNRWYGEASGRLEGVNIDNLDDDVPPEVEDDSGAHTLGGIKGSLVRDRTDSRWMPSDGDRFSASYEQMVGGFNFGRITGDYRIYRTIYVDTLDRKHIISSRIATGTIVGNAPVFERYYGGGIGSVRGFDYRGISPRSDGKPVDSDDDGDIDGNDNPQGKDEPIGGDFMLFAGIEYGFPIIGEQLRGVIFIDSGTVERGFEITTYRVSAGVGLRWIIPLMGPVPMSLDFAFPIRKEDEDDTRLINFSVGWTF